MTSFASKLLTWLTNRSPRNAAVPNVQPGQSAPMGPSSCGGPVQPIERNVEVRSIAGLLNRAYQVDSLGRGADDELVRYRDDGGGILAGCGHTVREFEGQSEKHQDGRRIAGLCAYCVREYQPQVQKGLMDPLHAERLSLVCSECAKISTSGYLCCPRHCAPTVGPDGSTHYVDSETAQKMARQDVVGKALRAVTWLFGDPRDPQDQQTSQE